MLAVPDRPISLADAVRALSTLPLATTKTEQPDQGRDRGVSDPKGRGWVPSVARRAFRSATHILTSDPFRGWADRRIEQAQ